MRVEVVLEVVAQACQTAADVALDRAERHAGGGCDLGVGELVVVGELQAASSPLVERLEGGGGRRELRWVLAGAGSGVRVSVSADCDVAADVSEEIILP